MAKIKGFLNKIAHEPVFHKTSIGRKPSLQKMNKNKRRRSFKKYRGKENNGSSFNIIFVFCNTENLFGSIHMA